MNLGQSCSSDKIWDGMKCVCPPGKYESPTTAPGVTICVGAAYCVTGQHYDNSLGQCVPDIPEKASLFSSNMVYILIGAVALLLLGGRK